MSHVDVVLATYKPAATLTLANWIHVQFDIPFVADLRDLVSACGLKRTLPVVDTLDRTVDRYLLRRAARVVSVTYTGQRKAEDFYRRPVDLVLNGFDGDCRPFRPFLGGDQCRLVYTGTLSASRSPQRLLALMREHNATQRTQVTLDIASAQDPASFGERDESCVRWQGFLSAAETRALQEASDVCVILEDQGTAGIENLPAKTFEYLQLGKPVLAICHPASDVGRVLSTTGVGSIVMTQEQFGRFIDGSRSTRRDEMALGGFSRERQTDHLIHVLRGASESSTLDR